MIAMVTLFMFLMVSENDMIECVSGNLGINAVDVRVSDINSGFGVNLNYTVCMQLCNCF